MAQEQRREELWISTPHGFHHAGQPSLFSQRYQYQHGLLTRERYEPFAGQRQGRFPEKTVDQPLEQTALLRCLVPCSGRASHHHHRSRGLLPFTKRQGSQDGIALDASPRVRSFLPPTLLLWPDFLPRYLVVSSRCRPRARREQAL